MPSIFQGSPPWSSLEHSFSHPDAVSRAPGRFSPGQDILFPCLSVHRQRLAFHRSIAPIRHSHSGRILTLSRAHAHTLPPTFQFSMCPSSAGQTLTRSSTLTRSTMVSNWRRHSSGILHIRPRPLFIMLFRQPSVDRARPSQTLSQAESTEAYRHTPFVLLCSCLIRLMQALVARHVGGHIWGIPGAQRKAANSNFLFRPRHPFLVPPPFGPLLSPFCPTSSVSLVAAHARRTRASRFPPKVRCRGIEANALCRRLLEAGVRQLVLAHVNEYMGVASTTWLFIHRRCNNADVDYGYGRNKSVDDGEESGLNSQHEM